MSRFRCAASALSSWGRLTSPPRLLAALVAAAALLGASAPAVHAECTPALSGDRTGEPGSVHASIYDGDLGTVFNSSWINWQYAQIDLGCTAEVRGFRRYMTTNGTAINGNRGAQGETFAYSLDGITWTRLGQASSRGWESYVAYNPLAWHSVSYGWSSWLRPLQPVRARYVRFHWDDTNDRVNELELMFAEEQTPTYDVVDLATLLPTGGTLASAQALNARGVVAGSYRASGGRYRAALWDLDARGRALLTDLDPPCVGICPASNSYALDVSDRGEVVGYRTGGLLLSSTAAQWQIVTAFPRPGLYSSSISRAINNEGAIAGQESEPFLIGGGSAAYRLHWDTPDRHGALLSGPTRSDARDLNDLADTVGELLDAASGQSVPYFYPGRTDSRLSPAILPLPAGYPRGSAIAVSNGRLAVGVARTAAGTERAVAWRLDGGQWNVSPLAAAGSAALGVNDVGDAVGRSTGQAVLWRNGRELPLIDLVEASQRAGWVLEEARDVNDRGEIVGVGVRGGRRTSFLLRPRREFAIETVDGAESVNDAGWVAGTDDLNAFLRTPGLPRALALGAGEAWDINDGGVVAGWEAFTGAALWEAPWTLVDLPSPFIGDPLKAGGVSESGLAVGFSNRFTTTALWWDEQHQVREPLPVGPQTALVKVNNSGHAAGFRGAGGGVPLRWSERFGQQTLNVSSFAVTHGINSASYIVGEDGNTGTRARIWDRSGQAAGLGTLESDFVNGSRSSARAVNDRGQIVGFHTPANSSLADNAAFLWEQGVMLDLNLLVPAGTPRLTSAYGINDGGQVITNADPSGERVLVTLSSEAEEAARLCRGWCQPVADCRGQDPWDIQTDIWTRPNYPAFEGCVNGCVANVLDPSWPHTLEEETAVRACFLATPNICAANWEAVTQTCCANEGLGSCAAYYP